MRWIAIPDHEHSHRTEWRFCLRCGLYEWKYRNRSKWNRGTAPPPKVREMAKRMMTPLSTESLKNAIGEMELTLSGPSRPGKIVEYGEPVKPKPMKAIVRGEAELPKKETDDE